MNQPKTSNRSQAFNNAQPDELDQILLAQDTLLPSSGFAASVMEIIQQEAEQATAPTSIPFPWKLAIPGIAALLAGIAILIRLAILTINSPKQNTSTDYQAWLFSSSEPAVMLRTQAAPVILALAASWLCVILCRRLAGGWSTR
ncbi:hypothetical protein [Acidicapsa ligni]|uniref:hypothetical protein n=1 Tax=Acidicapsa ligni TaxID=542300 RepID=UPI0021E06330|nr:hypothetical protein [Acidicapsa ligni]